MVTEKDKRFGLKGKQRLSNFVASRSVVHRTAKVSLTRRVSEDDGGHVVNLVHSSVQLLNSLMQ